MGLRALQKDLRNGMTIEEGLKKHNLTLKDVFSIKPQKKEKKLPTVHRGTVRKSNAKVDHYAVCKMISGKMCWYGVYHTRQEAEIIRNELCKVNWDKEELESILKDTGIKRVLQNERRVDKNTYIYPNGHGHFVVTKSKYINEKRKAIFGGTYTTRKEARIIRDELIKNNWDVSNLDELCEKHRIIRRSHKR